MRVRVPIQTDPGEVAPLGKKTPNPTTLPLVTQHATIRSTMEVIDRFAKGIAVVVDEKGCLLATVTDGDIRRAILAGVDLDHPICKLQKSGHNKPVVVCAGTSESKLIELMAQYSVRQI